MFGSELKNAGRLGDGIFEKVAILAKELETAHLQNGSLQKALKAQETRETELIRTNRLCEAAIEDQRQRVGSLRSRFSELSKKYKDMLSSGFYLGSLACQGRLLVEGVLKFVQNGVAGEVMEGASCELLKKQLEEFQRVDKKRLSIFFSEAEKESEGLFEREKSCMQSLEKVFKGELNLARMIDPLCCRFQRNLKQQQVSVDESINLSRELKQLLKDDKLELSDNKFRGSLAREDHSKPSSLIIDMPNCSSLVIPDGDSSFVESFENLPVAFQENLNGRQKTIPNSPFLPLKPLASQADNQAPRKVLSLVNSVSKAGSSDKDCGFPWKWRLRHSKRKRRNL
jgi:hypothetical protein